MDVIINGTTDYQAPEKCQLINQGNHWFNLLTCLGYPAHHLPLGELLARYHGLPGKWLIATPIYWQATHNDALIAAYGQGLQLTADEAKQLFNTVAQFLAAENLKLHYHDAELWLLNIDDKPAINSVTINHMVQQSMMPVLNKMDATLYWQRLLTELQMLLTTQAITQKRQNHLPVNGLWLYGENDTTIKINKKIITDDKQLQQAFPEAVELIDLTQKAKKNRVIVIISPEKINLDHLTGWLSKQKVRWFWHNAAYITSSVKWWQRIWRG